MADYLHRDDAPLSQAEWDRLDQTVVNTAKQHLVGRRFIPVFGPFGVGMQTIHHDSFSGTNPTCITMTGDCDEEPLGTQHRDYKRLPILHKDFQVHWRDIESSHQFGVPFDSSLAAAAAFFVANAEDALIFNGSHEHGIEGLLNCEKRNTIIKKDWNEPGSIFQDVVAAAEKLGQGGFYGPYALVVSPSVYALSNRVYENTGVLELDQVKRIVDAGVFRSSILKGNQAVVVSTGAQNMDIAISQDLITAYLDLDKMNHHFRVMEILTLRIKRPQSILTFE